MIICADDYGLREDIDRAILELCNRRRLTAVSCMVLFERCNAGALKRLLAHEGNVDIGLHLCLTDEGLPLSLPPLENKLSNFKSAPGEAGKNPRTGRSAIPPLHREMRATA